MTAESDAQSTDYVLTLEGPYSQVVWDYLEHEILPAMQRWVGASDIGLASHEWNGDGISFHSLLAQNAALQADQDLLVVELEELRRRCDAQAAALLQEFGDG